MHNPVLRGYQLNSITKFYEYSRTFTFFPSYMFFVVYFFLLFVLIFVYLYSIAKNHHHQHRRCFRHRSFESEEREMRYNTAMCQIEIFFSQLSAAAGIFLFLLGTRDSATIYMQNSIIGPTFFLSRCCCVR